MRKLLIGSLSLTLVACAGGPSSNPELLVFISRDSGITGSYSSITYDTQHVRSRIGPLACQSGSIESYSEDVDENGIVQFATTCSGPNIYEGTAGFTLNDVANAGHITASIDGRLVQIQLDGMETGTENADDDT